jgi:hypothetical protein
MLQNQYTTVKGNEIRTSYMRVEAFMEAGINIMTLWFMIELNLSTVLRNICHYLHFYPEDGSSLFF